MKASEIEVGNHYKAKVSGKLVTVRIDAIGTRKGYAARNSLSGRPNLIDKKCYECTNLVTGKKITVKTAQRFRSAATYVVPEPREEKPPKPVFHQNDRVRIKRDYDGSISKSVYVVVESGPNLSRCLLVEKPDGTTPKHPNTLVFNTSQLVPAVKEPTVSVTDQSLDDVIKLIKEWGEDHGITHQEMSNLLVKIKEVKGNACFTANVINLYDFYMTDIQPQE